ncbi:protein translocase subunit SecF, partial [Chloroflexota bacterium]
MFNVIGKRLWFFLIAGVVILVCVISLAVFGLKMGVEFSSGSVMTVDFEQGVE